MRDEKHPTPPYNVVISIAGPYGAGSTSLADELNTIINDWPGCKAIQVRVSDILRRANKQLDLQKEINDQPASPKRREDLQKVGTELRKKDLFSVGNLIALHILIQAKELEDNNKLNGVGTLFFIVDSLKNVNDVVRLKEIYEDEFFLIFISSDRETRWRRAKDYQGWQEKNRPEFDRLDSVDNNESLLHPHAGEAGQQVGKLATVADYYIVNSQNRDDLHESGNRFIHLIMGNDRNQPTVHEHSMHLAFSASLKSYCLSRQVGAAIIDEAGSLLSVGHNDVPKAGGGLYCQECSNDSRCYITGDRRCINDTNKEERFNKLIDNICKKAELEKSRKKIKKEIVKSEFKDATEYCRAVHAEMEALLSCLRSGVGSIRGGTMYVTTKPCHNCTKHILCSGLERVVYIEPYEKSLAEEFHSDAILVDAPAAHHGVKKMLILPFEGVSPRRYGDFFALEGQRKDTNGVLVQRTKESSSNEPRIAKKIARRLRYSKQFADNPSTMRELSAAKKAHDFLKKKRGGSRDERAFR